jgi:hypothetical protein
VLVEILPGSVVSHGCAGVGMAGCDWDVAKVNPGVEHRGHAGVAQHVRLHARGGDTGCECEVSEPAGGTVPVHAVSAPVEQDRPGETVPGGAFDGSRHGRWEWREDLLSVSDSHCGGTAIRGRTSNGAKKPRAEG